jgi:hypothetical protein
MQRFKHYKIWPLVDISLTEVDTLDEKLNNYLVQGWYVCAAASNYMVLGRYDGDGHPVGRPKGWRNQSIVGGHWFEVLVDGRWQTPIRVNDQRETTGSVGYKLKNGMKGGATAGIYREIVPPGK